MKISKQTKGAAALLLSFLVVMFLAVPARVAENIGRKQDPLITENLANVFDRERFALLTLFVTKPAAGESSCSGALVTNLWMVTAAHCVEDAKGNQVAASAVRAVGNWRSDQERKAVEIIRLKPQDLAIIRFAAPFRIFGSERRQNMPLWRATDPNLVGYQIRLFGRGRNVLAAKAPDGTAMPSTGDGQYRWGDVTILKAHQGDIYEIPPITLGGDSGGPAFFDNRIVAVVQGGNYQCLDGKADAGGKCEKEWVAVKTTSFLTAIARHTGTIAGDIARTAPPQWSQMQIRDHDFATDYLRPTVKIESDIYRADVCLSFGQNCGDAAAVAFCRANQRDFSDRVSWEAELFGHTGIAQTGETCFGPNCRAFKMISCLKTKQPDRITTPDPGPLVPTPPGQDDRLRDPGGFASALTESIRPGMENDTNRAFSDYDRFELTGRTPEVCQKACRDNPEKCRAWAYVRPGVQGPKALCYLKHSVPAPFPDKCCITGVEPKRFDRFGQGGGIASPSHPTISAPEENTDRPGSDFERYLMDDMHHCRGACVSDNRCQAWTFVRAGIQGPTGVCYLKRPAPAPVPNACCVSGTVSR